MSFLIGLALRFGVPPRFAKLATIAALIVFALSLFALGKCAYDRSVIQKHEAKQEAATAKADRKADTKAAEQRRVDDARLTQEAQELKEAQHGATSDLDRRLAFQRCLRLQQSARRDGKQPPSCGRSKVPARTSGTH